MRLFAYKKHSDGTPGDGEHIRDRVRLYLQILLIIDVCAYISEAVNPLLFDDLTIPDYSPSLRALRWGVTLFLAICWSILKARTVGRLTLITFECSVTVGLSLVYASIALAYTSADLPYFGPTFATFLIILLLSIRASLVPSPVGRTILVGISSVLCLYGIGMDQIRVLDPMILDGLTFISGAFVLATGVTSHVIYGLRREVREALQLGQYTLEEKLGEGGMGTVFRARHAMLQRKAAIKLIKPEQGTGLRGRKAVQRFEREAHVTADLKSPHTIQLYDFGISEEGTFYYVMELLDGVDLESIVATHGPMPPGRTIYVLRQVCDSLEEAHAADLIHRDIKPANIFLCRHGIRHDFVKVLDFGLVALAAGADQTDEKLTADGVACGTPAYLAPELVANPDIADERTDIYAIGCVAYWLLTGHVPFERETAMATIVAHVNEPATAPSRISEIEIPESLDTIVLNCLAKNPTDRPTSAADLSLQLAGVTLGESWDEERAARWWAMHDPKRRKGGRGDAGETPAKVTKVFR